MSTGWERRHYSKGKSLILCDADWYTEVRPCCGCCTHQRVHPDPVQVDG